MKTKHSLGLKLACEQYCLEVAVSQQQDPQLWAGFCIRLVVVSSISWSDSDLQPSSLLGGEWLHTSMTSVPEGEYLKTLSIIQPGIPNHAPKTRVLDGIAYLPSLTSYERGFFILWLVCFCYRKCTGIYYL